MENPQNNPNQATAKCPEYIHVTQNTSLLSYCLAHIINSGKYSCILIFKWREPEEQKNQLYVRCHEEKKTTFFYSELI